MEECCRTCDHNDGFDQCTAVGESNRLRSIRHSWLYGVVKVCSPEYVVCDRYRPKEESD